MLYVQEDDTDKQNLKFTIWAKGRALVRSKWLRHVCYLIDFVLVEQDLEAKTTQVRDKFMRALRYYIEAYKINPVLSSHSYQLSGSFMLTLLIAATGLRVEHQVQIQGQRRLDSGNPTARAD